jgi:DNA-binding LacI/PurR family transcriptional regulator
MKRESMKNRVTIRDVAAASNVSVATVSYVLNGKKKVSEETKQKILTVIDELGFVPDLNARGLTVKDTKLLGVVVPQTEPGSKLMFHNIFYSELLGSIEYAARQRGYHVIISATDVTEDYLQLIQERNLAGVIIIGTYQNQFFSELKTLDVPVVLIDSYCKYDYFHKLRIDDENCSNLATEFVIRQGHKKIALVTGHLQEDGVMQKRYKGFLKAIEQNGLEFQKENLYEATVDYESGVNAAKWFVDNKADITAVVATADVLAIGLMKGFYEQGVQVPEDISIIGFDDLDISKYTTPGLTTVKQPISAKGERAVEILIENIENPQMEKVEEVFLLVFLQEGQFHRRREGDFPLVHHLQNRRYQFRQADKTLHGHPAHAEALCHLVVRPQLRHNL